MQKGIIQSLTIECNFFKRICKLISNEPQAMEVQLISKMCLKQSDMQYHRSYKSEDECIDEYP